MRNKGVVITFTILFALVCIYQLSFTFVAYKVKQDAREYADGNLEKETAYLDSIASLPKSQWSFLGNTFKEVQEKEINLGLDLKGGMDVILEVSVEELIRSLTNYSQDDTFNMALDLARRYQRNSQEDFVTLFGRAYEEIYPEGQLVSLFRTRENQSRLDFDATNEEVLRFIREEAEVAIDNSFNILRNRIDRFGVIQPNIQRMETYGRIMIQLPGVKDPERVRKLLQGTARLEFWETYNNPEVYPYLLEANEVIKEIREAEEILEPQQETIVTEEDGEEEEPGLLQQLQEESQDTADQPSLLEQLQQDTTLADTGLAPRDILRDYPLFAFLQPNVNRDNTLGRGSVVGFAHFRDTGKINDYLRRERVRSVFPRDLKFMWDAYPLPGDETESYYELHALRITGREGQPPLTGEVITDARVQYGSGGGGGSPEVSMSMNSEGAKTWARLTRENVGEIIAIVLDGAVHSHPVVNQEITGGQSSITGNFTPEEAQDLANILKSGALPAPARIIQDTIVGPSLGQEAINSGLKSFLIAFIVVLFYMLFYYSRRAGLVADIALLANMFFLMGVLASLGAVLTLPGIAGIVLTIGMSVDANVLIYERIREEIAAGKGLKLAIADGYKNAYSAIIDANVTTILTGIILMVFGTGPIKGFATTLVYGILTSLFSAIFITRLIYEVYLRKQSRLTFATRLTENVFKNTNVNFIGIRKNFYLVSAFIIIAGIVSLFAKGLNPGVDFTGGRTYVVRFDEPVNTLEVQNLLEDEFDEAPQVIIFGQDNQVRITTKYKIEESDVAVDDEVEQKLYAGLQPLLGTDVTMEEFIQEYRQSSQKVGPTIAHDIKVQAVWAVLFALVIIFIYILIRFRNWQFGLGAVAALTHDALIVLGLFSILHGIMPFSLEIDQAFIAAILTVVGYSINDTVVVFDRIREYVGIYRKRERKVILNQALNSTLSRTFSTSLSTFFVLLTIFLFGGEVIRGFTFALLIGIIVGTYSSLFIASPVVYDTIFKHDQKKVSKGKK